mgnify:CR=1 FL=1
MLLHRLAASSLAVRPSLRRPRALLSAPHTHHRTPRALRNAICTLHRTAMSALSTSAAAASLAAAATAATAKPSKVAFAVNNVPFPLPRSLLHLASATNAATTPTLSLSFTLSFPALTPLQSTPLSLPTVANTWAGGVVVQADSDNYTAAVAADTYLYKGPTYTGPVGTYIDGTYTHAAAAHASAMATLGMDSADNVSSVNPTAASGKATSDAHSSAEDSLSLLRMLTVTHTHINDDTDDTTASTVANSNNTVTPKPASLSAPQPQLELQPQPLSASTAPTPSPASTVSPPLLSAHLSLASLLDQAWFALAAPQRWRGGLTEAANALAALLHANASPLDGVSGHSDGLSGADGVEVSVTLSLVNINHNNTAPAPATAIATVTLSPKGPLHRERNGWGGVDIIFEQEDTEVKPHPQTHPPTDFEPRQQQSSPLPFQQSPETYVPAGLYRLCIAPRRQIPWHVHGVMSESEMALSPCVCCCGLTALPVSISAQSNTATQSVLAAATQSASAVAARSTAGCTCHWGLAAHGHANAHGARWGAVLCTDRPRFVPHDETLLPPAQAADSARAVATKAAAVATQSAAAVANITNTAAAVAAAGSQFGAQSDMTDALAASVMPRGENAPSQHATTLADAVAAAAAAAATATAIATGSGSGTGSESESAPGGANAVLPAPWVVSPRGPFARMLGGESRGRASKYPTAGKGDGSALFPTDYLWAALQQRQLERAHDLAAPVSSAVSTPTVTFPGGLPGQTVIVSFPSVPTATATATSTAATATATEQSAHNVSDSSDYIAVPADAVLILAVTRSLPHSERRLNFDSPPGPPQLLFVAHTRRGWEFPGGKVDPGEGETAAVLRELAEEAGPGWRVVTDEAPTTATDVAQSQSGEAESQRTAANTQLRMGALFEYFITETHDNSVPRSSTANNNNNNNNSTDNTLCSQSNTRGGGSFGVGVRGGPRGTHLKRVYWAEVEPCAPPAAAALQCETRAVATAPLLLLTPEAFAGQRGVSALCQDQVAVLALRILQAKYALQQ